MIDIEKISKEELQELIIGKMERFGARFSRLLNEDSGRSEGWLYFDDKPQSWVRFKYECRKKGWGDLIDSLQIMEREMLIEHIENGLVEGFNSGDVDNVKIAVQALNGISTRAKISSDGVKSGGETVVDEVDSFEQIGIEI
jgi:hypothetical protein